MSQDLDDLFAGTPHFSDEDTEEQGPATPATNNAPPRAHESSRRAPADDQPDSTEHQAHEVEHSQVAHGLRQWTAGVARYPVFVLAVIIGGCALCSWASANWLGFKTKRADLINPQAEYHQRWLKFTEEFGDAGDLVVVVESKNGDKLRAALDDLGQRIEGEQAYFSDVLYKVDTQELQHKGLQFLSPDKLEMLLDRMAEFHPILRGKWQLLSINRLLQGLRFQIEQSLKQPGGQAAAALQIEVAIQLTRSLNGFLTDGRTYSSPWDVLWPLEKLSQANAPAVRYNLNSAGTLGVILAKTVGEDDGFEGAKGPIERLRTLIQRAEVDHPDVKMGLTGIPVLEYDEMHASQTAMILESIMSYAGVGILLVLGFRGIRFPVLALVMLAVATTLSFGFTTATIGHLNILSVSFVAIVVGLGIDYAILYLSRYMEYRQQGSSLQLALREASGTVGPGILTAAATTSLAFFCAYFTDFLGVAELGLIAGGGILLCALAAFTFLPAALAVVDRFFLPSPIPSPFSGKTLRKITWQHPEVVTLAAWAIVGLMAGYGLRVKYDYNLMNLQADGIESVELQKRIAEESDNRLLFAVAMADSPQQALDLKKRFQALPAVHHVEEVASALPEHPAADTQLLVQAIQVQLGHLPDQIPANRDLPNLMTLQRTLHGLQDMLEQQPGNDAFELLEEIRRLERTLQIQADDASTLVRGVMEYQYRLAGDLLHRFRALAMISDTEPVGIADLPPPLVHRFVGQTGKMLLHIYPKSEIWDIGPLEEFIQQLRSVDATVTGVPLQNYEASQQIRHSYEMVALYALMASYFVLLLDFLTLRQALISLLLPAVFVGVVAGVQLGAGLPGHFTALGLAYVVMTLTLVAFLNLHGLANIILSLLPPLVGALMTLGALGLIGVDLNPANLIILPLILGIGVDNGVHVMHDFRHQKLGAYRTSPSLINALFLTSMSNMAGFASMILAAHRGLRSIGMVLTIGVGSCLFVSAVLLPAMLTLWSRAIARWRGIDDSSVEEAEPGTAGETVAEAPTEPVKPAVPEQNAAPVLSLYYPDDAAA